jgi:hypothetical protein
LQKFTPYYKPYSSEFFLSKLLQNSELLTSKFLLFFFSHSHVIIFFPRTNSVSFCQKKEKLCFLILLVLFKNERKKGKVTEESYLYFFSLLYVIFQLFFLCFLWIYFQKGEQYCITIISQKYHWNIWVYLFNRSNSVRTFYSKGTINF